MSVDPKRNRARQLAADHVARGDVVGWFEPLYAEAAGRAEKVPWADLRPNPHLVEWLDRDKVQGDGRAALVVGCGLGDDAETLAQRGFKVTAFDIAPTAIDWCRERFPNSAVSYEVADLLKPPAAWNRAFAFILESYTLQVLPPLPRCAAMDRIAELLRAGGTLLVICRGRQPHEPEGQMPWPLLREELSAFEKVGLVAGRFEEFWDHEDDPPVRRFRSSYVRPVA